MVTSGKCVKLFECRWKTNTFSESRRTVLICAITRKTTGGTSFSGDRPIATIAQFALRKTAELVHNEYRDDKTIIGKATCMNNTFDGVYGMDSARNQNSELLSFFFSLSSKPNSASFREKKKQTCVLRTINSIERSLGYVET